MKKYLHWVVIGILFALTVMVLTSCSPKLVDSTEALNGKTYVRLKITNKDGSVEYSRIVQAQ